MNLITKMIQKVRKMVKKFWKQIAPSYRVALRVEVNTQKLLSEQRKKQDYLFWISQSKPGELISETKRRVFANLPPAEGITHECQVILNFLLREMNDICRQNNLSYWLMGGTLIGAIRHKGFIPWDDDADVGMMRIDYERLKEIVKEHPYIDVLEYYNFNGLYRIPKFVVHNSGSQIAIDIIIFDYVNANKESLKNIWKRQQKKRNAYMHALRKFKLKIPKHKGTDLITNAKKFEEVSCITNKYVKMCDYLRDDGDTVIWGIDNFTSHAWDSKRIYKKESIFPLKELEFEGELYYVTNDYMKMIISEAGDIWSFPNDAGTSKKFSNIRCRDEINKVNAVLSKDYFLKHELIYYRERTSK